MMECPRCGFTQPEDRYCASCGLDVNNYVAKPKPLFMRIVQNSNLHLSLIGILIALVIGYIFYSQRDLMSREVHHLMGGTPLLSRDAEDPNAKASSAEPDEEDEDGAYDDLHNEKLPDDSTVKKVAADEKRKKYGRGPRVVKSIEDFF